MDVTSRAAGPAGLLLAGLLVAGCATSAPVRSPGPDQSAVTIRHVHGVTVVPRAPERVVTLGSVDTQVAAALGARIVGAVRNPVSHDGGWPGVTPPLPADVTVLDDDVPDLERIAMLHPDLILATAATSGYADAYDRLSRIAPVVVRPDDVTGEEVTRMIGRALFRYAGAVDLIADSDAAVTRYAAAHPELAGTTYVLGPAFGGQAYVAATPGSPTDLFLGRLGLRLAPDVAALATSGLGRTPDGLVVLGPERLDVLASADLAIIGTWGPGSGARFRAEPVVASSGLATSSSLHVVGPGLVESLLRPNPAVTDYALRSLDRLW